MNAESAYCKQYVDQSRHKLLSEFESWYRLAFLGEVDEQQGEGLTASGAEQKVSDWLLLVCIAVLIITVSRADH